MSLASIRRKTTPIALFLSLFLVAGQAFAGLDVAFNFEIRAAGSGAADTNAAGFACGAAIAAPTIPTVTASGSGGTVAAATYYVVATYTDAWGETVISPEQAVTTSGATASFTTTSPSAQTYAKTWSNYCGTVSGGPYFPQGTGLTVGSNRVVTTTPPTTGTQPRGVDYSLQDSPQINVADGVANSTTTFTSATAGFTGAHVGNLIRVGAANWRHIVGVTNATTVVLDATVSTASSLPVVVGGAFATYGIVGAVVPQSGSILFIKYSATPYTYSASTNVSGGGIGQFPSICVVGYNTNRTVFNTDANRPTLKPTANSSTFYSDNGIQTNLVFSNFILANPDGKTGCTAFGSTGYTLIENMKVSGFTTLSSSGSNGFIFRFCDISVSGGTVFPSGTQLYGCDWHDGAGFQLNNNGAVRHCNVYNITSGSYAIECNNNNCSIENVNIYHLTAAGISAIFVNSTSSIDNVVVEDVNPSSGTGYVIDGLGTLPRYNNVRNLFYFNVKTGLANPVNVTSGQLYGATLLTASPFTAPGSGNFAPNNTVGGGKTVQAASLPTTFPAGTTVNALDAGAAQHAATGGASNIAF